MQERDHQLRVEELQEEISQRETHIIKLKEELKRLQASLSNLNKAVIEKDNEMLRVRQELKEQIRYVVFLFTDWAHSKVLLLFWLLIVRLQEHALIILIISHHKMNS